MIKLFNLNQTTLTITVFNALYSPSILGKKLNGHIKKDKRNSIKSTWQDRKRLHRVLPTHTLTSVIKFRLEQLGLAKGQIKGPGFSPR